MAKDVYDPHKEFRPYLGRPRPEMSPSAEELRALLLNPKRSATVEALIAQMLHGQRMPQTGMPEPYQHPPTGHVPVYNTPYTIREQDVPKMLDKAPPYVQSDVKPSSPDYGRTELNPIPNPGMPLMPGPPRSPILGLPLRAPLPPDAPDFADRFPHGMIGPDGEILAPGGPGLSMGSQEPLPQGPQPDVYYNIPEDPNAEDI